MVGYRCYRRLSDKGCRATARPIATNHGRYVMILTVFKTLPEQGAIITANCSTFQPSHNAFDKTLICIMTDVLRIQGPRDIYSNDFDEGCGKLKRDLKDHTSRRVLNTMIS